jgi:vitamin B12 transporter
MGKFNPFASASFGSYQTFRGAAGLNGQLGKFNYNLQYNHTGSKGFSSPTISTHRNDFDKDGFRQDNLQVNLGYQLTQKLSITSMNNFGVYETDLDAGAFSDDKDYTGENTNSINSVSLVYKTSKSALHFTNTILHAKRTLNDDSSSIGGFSKYARASYKGYSFISELTGNHSFTDRLSLVGGVQRLAQNTGQSFYSISDFGPYESSLDKDSAAITNYALYASLTLVNLEGFNAEAGIRYNNHSIYGNNTTYSFNPSYNIDENTRVFVEYIIRIQDASLYQLYSEYGNTDLQPEESNNYEAGVQSLSGDKRSSLRIVGFKRDIRHLIIFYSDPVTYAAQYINRDKQHDYGFEVESNLAIGKAGNWLTNITYVGRRRGIRGYEIQEFLPAAQLHL